MNEVGQESVIGWAGGSSQRKTRVYAGKLRGSSPERLILSNTHNDTSSRYALQIKGL